jgi:hypothetical protein
MFGWACQTNNPFCHWTHHTHTPDRSNQLFVTICYMGWLPMCKVGIMEDFCWLSFMLHNFHPLIWLQKTQKYVCIYVSVSAKYWMTKKQEGWMYWIQPMFGWACQTNNPFCHWPITHTHTHTHTHDQSNFCYNLLRTGFPCSNGKKNFVGDHPRCTTFIH